MLTGCERRACKTSVNATNRQFDFERADEKLEVRKYVWEFVTIVATIYYIPRNLL